MLNLDAQTQALLDAIEIDLGGHSRTFDPEADEKKLCIMEATAFIAGLPVSESPVCTSEVITDFMIGLNDSREFYDNAADELANLRQIVPELIGTCPTKRETVENRIGKFPATVRNETKGYLAAEQRRERRLLKELKKLEGVASFDGALGDDDEDSYGSYYIEFDAIPTKDGIRIARILAGIKNKV